MAYKQGESGNPAGRPKGAVGKVPTDKAIKDSLKKGSLEAYKVLQKLMRSGTEATKLKSAIKILDLSINIIYEDEKLKIKRGEEHIVPKEDNGTEDEVGTDDEGTDGKNVLTFKKS